ncbi:MAG: hypothetical protein GF405_09955 [Candidatus Eisenbacteria bacterium]|nr:hypothetical protein [Candidatus Eisenbacteria bacterium]
MPLNRRHDTWEGRMRQRTVLTLLAVCLVLGSLLGQVSAEKTAPEATPGTGGGEPQPIGQRALYSNIYVQSSAEYAACCRTIYTCAARALASRLASVDPPPVRPAVVMDLDETVLDNATFQTFLYMNDLEYTPKLWAEFERRGVSDVGLVPGAKDFIEHAESLGVTVVYCSNRNERNLMATRESLERLGLNADGLVERLYLKPDGSSSSKAARRDAISARYDVLMYFGDNLRDFSELFRVPKLADDPERVDYLRAIEERKAVVEETGFHWGVDWFVLPNPAYGEWEKLIPEEPALILERGDGASPAE